MLFRSEVLLQPLRVKDVDIRGGCKSLSLAIRRECGNALLEFEPRNFHWWPKYFDNQAPIPPPANPAPAANPINRLLSFSIDDIRPECASIDFVRSRRNACVSSCSCPILCSMASSRCKMVAKYASELFRFTSSLIPFSPMSPAFLFKCAASNSRAQTFHPTAFDIQHPVPP